MDTIELTTNQIEDHVSHIASTLRLWFSLTSLMRTTGIPPCVFIVATAVVLFEVLVVNCFFEMPCAKVCCFVDHKLGIQQVQLGILFNPLIKEQISSN